MALDGLRDRLLISGVSLDTSLQVAQDEAARYVIVALTKYEESPTVTSGYLEDVRDDLAAGIFKRRNNPTDMDTGWWGNGLKKLNTWMITEYEAADVDTLLRDAQISLLEAQAGLITAQTLNVPKTGTVIDAQAALIGSQKEKLDNEVELQEKALAASGFYFV